MMSECLQVFQKVLEEDPDVILRDYILGPGTYLLVGKDYQIKGHPMEIKMDEKKESIDRSAPYYKEFCYYDYYSKIISTNKVVDLTKKKIIHSNNYYTFWVKKENIKNGKLTKEMIDNYYEVLEEPAKKYKKGKALELYHFVEEKLGIVNQEILQKNKTWIKEHIFFIDKLISVDLKKNEYLKIFFEADYSEYEKEGKRYFIPNIYNKNEYNLKIAGEIFGLPDNNYVMNEEKPFLANQTRKISVPYLLDEKQVMLQKQMFDYFMNFVNAEKNNLYVDLERNKFEACRNDSFPIGSICGFFLRLENGKRGVEIHYQDVVPFYENKLKSEMEYQNYMKISNEKHPEYEMEYHIYQRLSELENLVDDVFFSKKLRRNYFTDAENIIISEEGLKRILLVHRMELFTWFHLNHTAGIKRIVEDVFLEIIKSSVINGYNGNAIRQINLRLSLLQYIQKGGAYMPDFSVSLRENLKKKLVTGESVGLESDTEYYYAVGQLARYFIFLNKSSKRNESLINPILNAKNSNAIRERILQYYKKYNYAIASKETNLLCKMVLGYETKGKVQQDMICMGYVDNNLILEKKEEKNDDE